MSGTITVSPTACYIDQSGIHAPTYQDVLNYLIGQYQSIYGTDTYLGNDSQDGQLLAVFALAIHDANSATVACYNAFSPSTAQGAGLSSVVKINGIARLVPSNSNVDVICVGQAGTPIIGGIAVDVNNDRWFLPTPITIPISGQITVTAIAEFPGAVTAVPNTVTTIGTPTRGWQTVTNPGYANVGAPIELDGALRQRQTTSTMLASEAVLDGIVGAIYNLTGVTRVQPYENATSLADFNGVSGHSIAIVAEGGSAQQIGNTILLMKTPGTGTFGTTSVTSYDSYGNPNTINFYRPTIVTVTAVIHIIPLTGYTTTVGNAAVNSVIAALKALPIGADVIQTRMIAAAYNTPYANYSISSLLLSRSGGSGLISGDLVLFFTEAATGDATTVTVIIG